MTSNSVTSAGMAAASSQTILIIDDDAAMRTILSFTLKGFGYLTLVAADGEEALQVARNQPQIRLIIMDVVMTGLSGKDLADQLQISLPKAAILFSSGHPPETMSLHGIDLSSSHFMQKPCRPPELQRKIEELIATTPEPA
jgi:two-component system, cell cycle sensor histidine kinase and response regulator CckA